MNELSSKERSVVEALEKKLKIPKSKTKNKVAVGIIGLVGSGKSLVSDGLAREIGAVVIRADDIRIMLRKKKIKLDNVHDIVHSLTESILKRGGNVVVDSDFAWAHKRNEFKKVAKDAGADMYFVRTVKDLDVIIGDIMNDRYGTPANDLFAGADSNWKGTKKGAVVRIREMTRRLPHHYLWSKDDGGQWIQKTIPEIYTTIDTTKKTSVAKEVKDFARMFKR